MTIDPMVLMVILLMAVVTYSTRASGYYLVRHIELGPRARRILEHTPGAMFAALCAPAVVAGGPVEWAGAAVTVVVMRLSGNLFLAMFFGVGLVAAARMIF